MGMSTAGTSGSIAWHERRPNRCVDCGHFVETFPAYSVRDGAAFPVCRRHSTTAELAERERLGRKYDRMLDYAAAGTAKPTRTAHAISRSGKGPTDRR